MDAKFDALGAKIDAKFDALRGKIDRLSTQLYITHWILLLAFAILLGFEVGLSIRATPPAPAPVAVVRPAEASAPPASVDCPPLAQEQLPSSE